MGYYNVCLKFGENNFLKECKNVGVDGLIISDLPFPENIPFVIKCRNIGISFVQLIAPTTSNERIAKINEYADEMVYYISMLGVTGSALKNSPEDIQKKYLEIKKLCSGNKRTVIGFGITQDVIKKFKNVDGLVVGSQICKTIEKNIENGQNSAVVEVSKLYKALLNEL
jgi:tryptophan synthase alpha chain